MLIVTWSIWTLKKRIYWHDRFLCKMFILKKIGNTLGLKFSADHLVMNNLKFNSQVAKTYIEMLNQLKSASYDLTKIYAVGHSLGAHLAGKIGEILLSRNILLSRITGLDPAGEFILWSLTFWYSDQGENNLMGKDFAEKFSTKILRVSIKICEKIFFY